MTQLYIEGVEVVLPKEFSTTVKRENSFFTKNGEYTYDVTLNLDNATNKNLWPIWRLNNSKKDKSKRSAVLVSDNHVYCNGTEVITGWSESTVTIQIVSGNSELNYFIGQDLEIKWLTGMGEVPETELTGTMNPKPSYPDVDYCLPVIYNESKQKLMNPWVLQLLGPVMPDDRSDVRVQPFIIPIIKKLINALGYTITLNQLDGTEYEKMFFMNFVSTRKYCEMFPGWTAKNLLEELENLLNIVFVVDNSSRDCKIYIKSSFYTNASQQTVRDVIDAYEAEVEDGSDAKDVSNSNVKYSLPSTDYYKMAKLAKKAKASVEWKKCASFSDVLTAIGKSDAKSKIIYEDTSTGRLYIYNQSGFVYNKTSEVDLLRDLIRDDTTDDSIEIKLAPAPFASIGIAANISQTTSQGGTLVTNNIGCNIPSIADSTDESEETTATTTDSTTDTPYLDDYLKGFNDDDSSSQCQLYIAMYNGVHHLTTVSYKVDIPCCYTDGDNFSKTGTFNNESNNNFVGSLRLENISNNMYDNAYVIDNKKGITLESYDPNIYDVHKIFIINNKRYVCEYIEETIKADGRDKKWKGVFYPIELTDTDANKNWVIKDGRWHDDGVWIDDARWEE